MVQAVPSPALSFGLSVKPLQGRAPHCGAVFSSHSELGRVGDGPFQVLAVCSEGPFQLTLLLHPGDGLPCPWGGHGTGCELETHGLELKGTQSRPWRPPQQ